MNECGTNLAEGAPGRRGSAVGPYRLAALAVVLSLAWLATAVGIAFLRPTSGAGLVSAAAAIGQAEAAIDEDRRETLVLADDIAERRMTTRYWQERRAEKRSDANTRQATVDPSLRTAHVRAPETGFQAFSTLWGGEPYDPAFEDGATDRSVSSGDAQAPARPVAFRTVCVRLCDGYFYPLSPATTPQHFEKDEQRCASSCASPVRLFVYPNPGGVPEDMEDLDGRAYTALPTAFLYRSSYQRRCTCQPQPWTAEANARHDEYAARAVVARKGEFAVAAIERVAEPEKAVEGLILPVGRSSSNEETEPHAAPRDETDIVPLPVRGLRDEASEKTLRPVTSTDPAGRRGAIAASASDPEAQQKKPATTKRRRKRAPTYAEARTVTPTVVSLLPVVNAEPIRRPPPRVTTDEILRRNLLGRY